MVVVLWRSPDGKHHLQTGNLRNLLALFATNPGDEPNVEQTDSIIEVAWGLPTAVPFYSEWLLLENKNK